MLHRTPLPVEAPSQASPPYFFTLGEYSFEYTIHHKNRRKSVKIQFRSPSQLEITAPANFDRLHLEKLLREKSSWLHKTAEKLTLADQNPLNQTIASGEQLLYLGQQYTLSIHPGSSAAISFTSDNLQLQYPKAWDGASDCQLRITNFLYAWYREQAIRLLNEKTRHWAAVIGVQPINIRVKEQKSRWGSCSSRANINYNWRLIMAPPEVMDYLVVHELCHLQIPNHSRQFWALVQHHFPACRISRQWLKQNGSILGRLFSP